MLDIGEPVPEPSGLLLLALPLGRVTLLAARPPQRRDGGYGEAIGPPYDDPAFTMIADPRRGVLAWPS